MDSISKDQRRVNMSHIRSRDTQGELVVRYLLYHAGYRYRIAPKYIEGRPDIYIASRHAAIFINGCFWHHHENCRYATVPKSNTEFWLAKFESNRRRDSRIMQSLQDDGLRVLVIWECALRKALKSEVELEYLKDRIIAFLESDRVKSAEI